ncbi:uncharacterized protein CTRU02_213546 [Colletotrichum truncatum]|uniref:Uncharacterized protein n=1 Tax=Colletotrichum truncatum TaxID=5467 RepID=A0ACC3YG39_COLTU
MACTITVTAMNFEVTRKLGAEPCLYLPCTCSQTCMILVYVPLG